MKKVQSNRAIVIGEEESFDNAKKEGNSMLKNELNLYKKICR